METDRGHGGLLVGCIRHLHKAAQHTHSLCTAAHTAQADRFDIRKRSGWLAGWWRRTMTYARTLTTASTGYIAWCTVESKRLA